MKGKFFAESVSDLCWAGFCSVALDDAILPARNYPYVVSRKKMVSSLPGNKIFIDQACRVKMSDETLTYMYELQQQPRLAHIFNQPPIVSYRKEKSLKDFLVRA